ncbi:unnamed protein product [Paramecium sonneborni]|uniref:ATP-dependent RNA helicase n=1 Tax=Paramecium sonneborni TaxID=65129 RepID=A0A8S1LQ81_9CILI|nr:unnamed protein product [Paramecium sonneborni]
MLQSDNLEYVDQINSWIDLGNQLIKSAPNQQKQFTKELRDKLKSGNYQKPAPIQKMVLPYLLQEKTEERFVYIKSPTGTGKTLAFILPIIFFFDKDYIQQFYQAQQEGPVQYYPYAIILVATHALLAQIQKDFIGATPDSLLKEGFKVQHFDKGQDESIIMGHVLCGVPQSILRLIQKKTINLKNVRFIVVDEADNTILNDKNQKVIQIISKFLESNNLRWKIISCGATMEVQELKELFITQLGEKKQDQQENQSFFNFKYFNFQIALDNIYHYYDDTADREEDMLQKMVSVIKDTFKTFSEAQIMIFFNAKTKCHETKLLLMNDPQLKFLVEENYLCEIVQDGLQDYATAEEMRKSQQKIVDDFKNGVYKIMFCSDLMGRGMNFRKVRLVINYGAPRVKPYGEFDLNRYNQRVGRTGRMEDLGVALTILNKSLNSSISDSEFKDFIEKKISNLIVKKYETTDFFKQLKDVYTKTQQKQK